MENIIYNPAMILFIIALCGVLFGAPVLVYLEAKKDMKP